MNDETTGSATDTTASQVEQNALEGAAASPDVQAKPESEDKPAKPEKTPEQRRIDQLQRGIDRKTQRAAQLAAENEHLKQQLGLTRNKSDASNASQDDEPISLTRAELAERVKAEAEKLAPTLQEQRAEAERRSGVVKSLEKAWGADKFNEMSSELDDVFGGLSDAKGRAKPATEAIFEAEDPARVIEFLTDPDNADEAERISKLGPVQAGLAIARIEAKLPPKAEQKGAAKKEAVSKAAAPLEQIRSSGGKFEADESRMSDAEWTRHREEQSKRKRA